MNPNIVTMQSIYNIFQELDIKHTLYEHPPFFTCDESADWYQDHLDQDSGESKNLFLRNKKGNKHYLVVIESKKHLDLKKLSQDLSESKLSFASTERLEKYLNVKPGSVSPFALIHPEAKGVKVILDQDLLSHSKLHFHPPGRNDQTIVLSTEDLKKFLNWVENSIEFIKL